MIIIIIIINKGLVCGENKATHSRLLFIIIKALSYLLKFDRSTNKKYLCESSFEMHLCYHIYI